MSSIVIRNIGELFTGDLDNPRSTATSILIEGGEIAALDPDDAEADQIIDARGSAVLPGLVDGHVHPVFGEWTPTQDAIGWIGNYVHGGTTTMLSAGELHVPGIDYANLTPELVTSLAVVTASTTGRVRWSGAKVHAGCVLLVPGMTEAHFDRLAAVKATLAKFIFYPFSDDRREALQYTEWCRQRGIRVKVHTGGVSRSGANVMCGFDILSWLKPDIAAHMSGGPVPMSDADIDKVIDETSFALEICSSGNYGSTLRAVKRLAAAGKLRRITAGTDTPSGTGVVARGMWQLILFMTSVCGIAPADAIAVATGNTAKAHGLDVGIIAAGRPADLIVCGPIQGSPGTTLSDAIGHGDLPGISLVVADGKVVVEGRSRITPPPMKPAHLFCCGVGEVPEEQTVGGGMLIEGKSARLARFRCD